MEILISRTERVFYSPGELLPAFLKDIPIAFYKKMYILMIYAQKFLTHLSRVMNEI